MAVIVAGVPLVLTSIPSDLADFTYIDLCAAFFAFSFQVKPYT